MVNVHKCVVNRYGKTKDAFGWPEEIEDSSAGQSTSSAPVTTINNDPDNALAVPTPLSSVNRYACIVIRT